MHGNYIVKIEKFHPILTPSLRIYSKKIIFMLIVSYGRAYTFMSR